MNLYATLPLGKCDHVSILLTDGSAIYLSNGDLLLYLSRKKNRNRVMRIRLSNVP